MSRFVRRRLNAPAMGTGMKALEGFNPMPFDDWFDAVLGGIATMDRPHMPTMFSVLRRFDKAKESDAECFEITDAEWPQVEFAVVNGLGLTPEGRRSSEPFVNEITGAPTSEVDALTRGQ